MKTITSRTWALFCGLSLLMSAGACKPEDLKLEAIPCRPAAELGDALRKGAFIGPAEVRKLLLDGNPNILRGALQLRRAKDNVQVARANLFPSLGLGMLVSSGSPSFQFSSVEYLLPFLLPSKWFELSRSKKLAEAEKAAFQITKLNQFASAYALTVTLLRDLNVRGLMAETTQDLILLEELVAHAVESGWASDKDLAETQAQALEAQAGLIKMQELVHGEIASFRQALNLCPEVPIEFAEHTPAPSSAEGLKIEEAAAEAWQVAPEAGQIRSLLEAAGKDRWSKVFSVIASASAGNAISGMVPGESLTAFSHLKGRGSLNLGYATFLNVELTHRNTEELRLRANEAYGEIMRLLNASLGRIALIQERLRKSEQAEAGRSLVYDRNRTLYAQAKLSLQDLLKSQQALRQARVDRIQAQADLDLERVTLHRLYLSGEFAPLANR